MGEEALAPRNVLFQSAVAHELFSDELRGKVNDVRWLVSKRCRA